jgi:hypothetical protein
MVAVVFALLVVGTQQPAAPTRDIPNASWEPIFFGDETDRQSINGRAKLGGLAPLRSKLLPKGVAEIRVWQGFGITYLEGYRFRLEAGNWRGWKLEPAIPGRKDLKDIRFQSPLKPPTQGWPAFWKAMEAEGLYTLSDFEALPGKKNTVLDGMSYVVEFQKEGKYRTYCYDNPSYQPKNWKEIDNIINIAKLLHQSFPESPRKS